MFKIYVNDNPNTGICDIVDHWKQALNKEPQLNGVPVFYNEDASEDSVIIKDHNDTDVAIFTDASALRLDIISEDLQELKGGAITWEEFIETYKVEQ